MAKSLVSPAGTVVTVDDELAVNLERMGWAESEPKRKPGRPKKQD